MNTTASMNTGGALGRALRRDRAIVLGAVAAVVMLACLYTLSGIGMSMSAVEMTGMARAIGAPMRMVSAPEWGPGYAALVFAMWLIMMIAMMTPSAAPTLLLFAALKRHSSEAGSVVPLTWLFLSGYLLMWAGFSIAATGLQWAFQAVHLMSPTMMTIDGAGLAGAVLILAGLYQFAPLKDACLEQCRSPAQFLSERRRPGAVGALRMGAEHGAYCLGCCWALMALLFVGGIMNLWWIAGIAGIVAAEKLAPNGRAVPRVIGAALIIAGLWVWLKQITV